VNLKKIKDQDIKFNIYNNQQDMYMTRNFKFIFKERCKQVYKLTDH